MDEHGRYEKDAPWRDTPLDHWNKNVDPFIMSGDQWVDNEHDPGMETAENNKLLRDPEELRKMLLRGERFMHPVHDVTYRDEPEP